jgi:uncharacterized membrane protein YhaH (DUF805 family)|tara:strand:- start:50 stop:1291 length:1242 start_codon:yes stop_codon:yes gene_type:complete
MIYKFIDDNNAEITVNSLSSLQELVDSQTIKENTKVKAGLRGKWLKANELKELKFKKKKEEKPAEKPVDVESFITREPTPTPSKEEEATKVDLITPIKSEESIEETEVKSQTEIIESEDLSKEVEKKTITAENKNQTATKEGKEDIYADENMEDINLFRAVKICFQKFFIFTNRASRSEYWWFILSYSIFGTIPTFLPNENVVVVGYIISFLFLIPAISVTVRRLHDINKSGWFIFISLIPIIGSIILLFWTIEKGTLGKNRFGEYPLAFKKKNGENKIKETDEEIATQSTNIKQDKDFFIKVLWRGDYSLKQSFWAFYLLPAIIFTILVFLLLPTVLLPTADAGVTIIYYLIVFTAIFYSILSWVGTWKSANKYTIKKKLEKKPNGWAIAAQIIIFLDVISRLVNIAKVMNE